MTRLPLLQKSGRSTPGGTLSLALSPLSSLGMQGGGVAGKTSTDARGVYGGIDRSMLDLLNRPGMDTVDGMVRCASVEFVVNEWV